MGNAMPETFVGRITPFFREDKKSKYSILKGKILKVKPAQQLQVQNGEQLSVSLSFCWSCTFENSAFALVELALSSMQGVKLSRRTREAIIKAKNFIVGKNNYLMD